MNLWIWLIAAMALLTASIAYATGYLHKALRIVYGDLTPGERTKFVLYGALLGFVIGIYWSLRCVKDSIFNEFIGSEYAWKAKLISLVVVFPLVITYSYLVDWFPRHRLFYAMALIFSALFLGMAYLLNHPAFGIYASEEVRWRLLGWVSYVLIESYGSLVPALFYAFMADTTTPESGKKGFFITATFAQFGAVIGSGMVATKSGCWGVPLLVAVSAVLILSIIPIVAYIYRAIPKEEMSGYQAKGGAAQKKGETGFVEGLKLMFAQPYLLGIFVVVGSFEMVATIFDLQFKILIALNSTSSGAYAAKAGEFGVATNILAIASLLLGIGNIGRKIGIKLSLALMPLLMAVNTVFMFISPSLSVAFWVMVCSKGINYAFNQPSKEQLFIPTTKEVKYKAKAWTDMFGSRSSKAAGSLFKGGSDWFNIVFGNTAALLFLAASSLFICSGWFMATVFLGKKHAQALKNNEVVC